MDRFTNGLLAFIRKEKLLCRGDTVVVGFSGGADSTCLLQALWGLRGLLKIRLFAVHINHGLRGEESLRDEQFCRNVAGKLGVPFAAFAVSVREKAEAEGMSLEEAGRMLRYAALEQVRAELEAGHMPQAFSFSGIRPCMEGGTGRYLIASAHHADDQAETILFHLLRGSGLRGLSGMEAKRGVLIRPLLCMTRAEILNWLTEQNISYVMDSTNLCDDYTRNFLRNRILPELCSGVNARAAQHIRMAGQACGEADAYLRMEAQAFLDSAQERREVQEAAERWEHRKAKVSGEEKEQRETAEPEELTALRQFAAEQQGINSRRIKIPHAGLKEKPQIFRRYVIIEALGRLGAPLQNIGERHIADLDKALFCGRGFHLDLPNGICADNGFRETVLYQETAERKGSRRV